MQLISIIGTGDGSQSSTNRIIPNTTPGGEYVWFLGEGCQIVMLKAQWVTFFRESHASCTSKISFVPAELSIFVRRQSKDLAVVVHSSLISLQFLDITELVLGLDMNEIFADARYATNNQSSNGHDHLLCMFGAMCTVHYKAYSVNTILKYA